MFGQHFFSKKLKEVFNLFSFFSIISFLIFLNPNCLSKQFDSLLKIEQFESYIRNSSINFFTYNKKKKESVRLSTDSFFFV